MQLHINLLQIRRVPSVSSELLIDTLLTACMSQYQDSQSITDVQLKIRTILNEQYVSFNTWRVWSWLFNYMTPLIIGNTVFIYKGEGSQSFRVWAALKWWHDCWELVCLTTHIFELNPHLDLDYTTVKFHDLKRMWAVKCVCVCSWAEVCVLTIPSTSGTLAGATPILKPGLHFDGSETL